MRHEAIYIVYPDCIGITDGVGAYDSNQKLIEIDESLVQAKIAELQAQYEANEYQRQRAAEYPSWQDQLDKIYHDGVDVWKAEIKAIKDKYPKPDQA